MANPEHVAKLKEGWEAWNEWRKASDEKPDLSEEWLSDYSFQTITTCIPLTSPMQA